MAEIFSFTSKSETSATENLSLFIEQCRTQSTVFGADLDWQNWRWPKTALFSKLGVSSQSKNENGKLDEHFIDFAKAYLPVCQPAVRQTESELT